MPAAAIAARSCCSEARTSGRRRSNSDGNPTGSDSANSASVFILLRTTRQSGFSPMSSEMLFSMTSILRSRSGINAAVEAYSTFACWKTVSEVRPPSKRNCAW